MKMALISEGQIKAIGDALEMVLVSSECGSYFEALAIIQSLNPSEPFSYYKTQKNMGEGARESTSWYSRVSYQDDCDTVVPLYSKEMK